MQETYEEVAAILEHDQGNTRLHAEDLARRIILDKVYGIPKCSHCGSSKTEFVRKGSVAVFCTECGSLVED